MSKRPTKPGNLHFEHRCHFVSVKNGGYCARIDDDEIETWRQKTLEDMLSGEDYSFIGGGDAIVIGLRLEDEILIFSARGYTRDTYYLEGEGGAR